VLSGTPSSFDLRSDAFLMVFAVASAPDGRILTGGDGKCVNVWARESAYVEATLSGSTGDVRVLCALTDGTNRVLSGGSDYVVRLHDLDAAHGGARVAPTREYRGHSRIFGAIVELPGGRFASGSYDGAMRIWDTESGACLATLSGHTGSVLALAVVDDDTLVSGSWDKTLRVWDTRTYAAVAVIETPSPVRSLLRLAYGMLASGHWDGVVRLWDWRNCTVIGKLRGHVDGIWALAQLPDGRLVSVSRDGTVRVWDVAARRCVGFVTTPHQMWTTSVTSGGRLVVAGHGVNAYVYDVDAAMTRV